MKLYATITFVRVSWNTQIFQNTS